MSAKATGFNLIIFHSDIRGKLSIKRCDKFIVCYYFEEKNTHLFDNNKLCLYFNYVFIGIILTSFFVMDRDAYYKHFDNS